MINVGIIGGETEAAGELIRILINHPDVIIREVSSAEFAGCRIDRFHRGLTGDTELCFVSEIDTSKLNCVFLVGESWQAAEFMAKVTAPSHCAESDEEENEDLLRIIDLTGSFLSGEHGMVYGFPECYRKALVRGALRASVLSAIATGVELALFPLAKNHLLNGTIDATVSRSRKSASTAGNHSTSQNDANDLIASQLSTRLDPIAPVENRPDTEKAADEIAAEIKRIDSTFNGRIDLRMSTATSGHRGMTVMLNLQCNINVDEIIELYKEAYSDHSFTFVIDRQPETADISNTNKCLIQIIRPTDEIHGNSGSELRIIATFDDLIKGSAGTAVHCMNLLFGLSERTGLSLKASVI